MIQGKSQLQQWLFPPHMDHTCAKQQKNTMTNDMRHEHEETNNVTRRVLPKRAIKSIFPAPFLDVTVPLTY